MKLNRVLKIILVLVGLVALTACCGGDYGDNTSTLNAAMSQNNSGQGVAAWKQPTSDGIAIARFDATGVWSGTLRIGSEDNAINVSEITQPSVAANGDQFVLWRSVIGYYGSGTQFYLSRYVAASDTWNNIELPTGATSNPLFALQAKIDTDAAGNAWLLWVDGNSATDFGQIWVAHYDATTSVWDVVSRLDNGTDTGQSASIAVNATGIAIASWSRATGSGLWASRYIAGAWETQAQVASSVSGKSGHLDIVLDDTGNCLLAWNREISTSISEVYAVAFNGGTSLWSNTTKLDVDSFAGDKLPKASMRGTAGYVAWRESGQLWASRNLAGSGTFDMPVSLASNAGSFSLVSTTDGRAYLGWHDSSSGTIQVRTYLPMATGWSSFAVVPAPTEDIAGLLATSTDDTGNLTVLWEQQNKRKHPDPMMCSMEYKQIWSSRYNIGLAAWERTAVLDTKRTR